MPKPALIEDSVKREIAIAVVMAVVLVASLLLVVLLTAAPILSGQADPVDDLRSQGPPHVQAEHG